MIHVQNAKGKTIVTIDDHGALWLGDHPCVKAKGLASLGFHEEYTRAGLSGGTVTLYVRNDGTKIRRHLTDDREWWDVAEYVCMPADIDRVRKEFGLRSQR